MMSYYDSIASYTYDAFGRTVSQSGPMAGAFSHRFSTKYYDTETGLYYYGYRFYHPALRRWLNRDPIGEDGGMNLYAFCDNSISFDIFGLRTWTKESAKAYLENLILRWQGNGWNFAAAALQHFLNNTEENGDLSKYSRDISDNVNWRNAFLSNIASKLEDNKPMKEIGDIEHRASFTTNLRDISFSGNSCPFATMFEYRFYPMLGGWNLFYALYGSRFSYYGKAAKKTSRRISTFREDSCCEEITLDVMVATWDATTYPVGFGRNMFDSYEAAMFLESHGYRHDDYIYLRWQENGTWRKCRKMLGNNYIESNWEKLP